MEAFLTIVHVVIAIALIGLVLIQDSKSGSLGGAFGGGGSNSVFGATGAVTLAQKLTRWIAILFAISCLTLSVLLTRKSKSVVDSMPMPQATAPVSFPPGTNGAVAGTGLTASTGEKLQAAPAASGATTPAPVNK